MITVEKVLKIHDVLIHEFGGKAGIRDLAVLESAINRPFTGVADQEFYPTIEEKAAVYLESIVAGHPFSDGNKRTGVGDKFRQSGIQGDILPYHAIYIAYPGEGL